MFLEFSKVDKIIFFSFKFFKYLRFKKHYESKTKLQTNDFNKCAYGYPNNLLHVKDIQESLFITF